MSPLELWKRISVLCGKDCFEALPTSRESTTAACKSAPGLVADIIKKTKQNTVINIKNKYTGATKLFMMTNTVGHPKIIYVGRCSQLRHCIY